MKTYEIRTNFLPRPLAQPALELNRMLVGESLLETRDPTKLSVIAHCSAVKNCCDYCPPQRSSRNKATNNRAVWKVE